MLKHHEIINNIFRTVNKQIDGRDEWLQNIYCTYILKLLNRSAVSNNSYVSDYVPNMLKE